MEPFRWFFGYGSLMYPSGINGRGMKHIYTWEDLHPATLNHFQRGLFAEYRGILYYGMMLKQNSKVNGVIFPIFTEEDLEALLINEGAHQKYANTKAGRMYQTIGTSDYTCESIDSLLVLTLINMRTPDGYGRVAPWYVAHVWNGIQPWGKKFTKEFLKSGGVKPSDIAKKTSFLYTWIKKGKTWLLSKSTAKTVKNS